MGKKTKAQEKEVDLTVARDARCVPLAFEFFGLLAVSKALAGAANAEDMQKSYNKVCLQILTRFLEEKVLLSEISYVQQVMKQIVEAMGNTITMSVNQSLVKAQEAAFGKQISELGFDELDTVLKDYAKKLDTSTK